MLAISSLLTLAGAIPFVALSLDFMAEYIPAPFNPRMEALHLYSAIILAFLGGIQWGSLLKAKATLENMLYYGVSVLPALAGWWWLLQGSSAKSISLSFAAAFAAMLVYEAWLGQRNVYPAWFWQTRLWVTIIVVLSLVNAGMDWL